MVPRDSITNFLADDSSYRNTGNLPSVIDYLAKTLLRAPLDNILTKTLKDFCGKAWSSGQSQGNGALSPKIVLPEPTMTKVLQAAITLKDQDFIKDAADKHEGNLSLDFFKWARDQLAAEKISFDSIKNR
jgi:hypothetical protein